VRLGELLVHTGAVTAEQRDAGLRQQVVYGGRLGTNLIELGYAPPDAVAHALARLHRVPASLERHFERHAPDALALVPAALAARFAAFPIALADTHAGRRLVVCLRDPHAPGALDALSQAAGTRALACVAPELVLLYWLERCYGIPRHPRYRVAHVGANEPLPAAALDHAAAVDVDLDVDDEVDMPALQLVELDHADVGRDYSHYDAPQGNRASSLDLAAAAAQAVARADARADAPALSAAQAAAAIRAAADRDAIADAVVGFLRGRFGAGLMAIVKEGMALGHRGCGGSFDDTTVETILIPLGAPSMFRVAFDARRTCRGAPPAAGKAIQDRFFKLFPLPAPPSEVAVVPVVLRDRVVCLIYAHARGGAALDGAAVAELEQVAAESAAAYLHLLQAGKR
jgi:hypothetical protein